MSEPLNPIVPGPDGQPVRSDRPMTDEEVAQAGGQVDTEQAPRTSIIGHLVEVVRILEPLDMDTAIEAAGAEPLTADDPTERRQQAMRRADHVELLRAFAVLRTTGMAIVRRLDEDDQGLPRDE